MSRDLSLDRHEYQDEDNVEGIHEIQVTAHCLCRAPMGEPHEVCFPIKVTREIGGKEGHMSYG